MQGVDLGDSDERESTAAPSYPRRESTSTWSQSITGRAVCVPIHRSCLGKIVSGARSEIPGDALIRTVSSADGGRRRNLRLGLYRGVPRQWGGVGPGRRDGHRDRLDITSFPASATRLVRTPPPRRLRLRGPRRGGSAKPALDPFELASRVQFLPVVPVRHLGIKLASIGTRSGRKIYVDIRRGWLGAACFFLRLPQPQRRRRLDSPSCSHASSRSGEPRVPVLLNGGGRRGDLSGRRSQWRGRGLR